MALPFAREQSLTVSAEYNGAIWPAPPARPPPPDFLSSSVAGRSASRPADKSTNGVRTWTQRGSCFRLRGRHSSASADEGVVVKRHCYFAE